MALVTNVFAGYTSSSMFDDVVSNIVAIGALIVLTVFGLGLLSTLAAPSPRGPVRPRPHPHSRPHHHRPEPRPEPHHHHRPTHHQEVGGCAGTKFGCCPDGKTPRTNRHGTQCPPDHPHEQPAYSPGNSLPRHGAHPTMSHANTPPSTTLLLIDETTGGSGGSTGVVEGFTQRVRSMFGGSREGLTAKQKERIAAEADDIVKSLTKQANEMKRNMFNPTDARNVLDAYATYLDALVLQNTVDQSINMPHQISSGNMKTVYATINDIKNLSEFASLVKQKAKMAPIVSTPDLDL